MRLFQRPGREENHATQADLSLIKMVQDTQAVIRFKSDGTILDANQNFLDALGYTAEELFGNKHAMFIDPTYRESRDYQDFWDSLHSGKVFTGQFPRLHKNGSTVWIQATYAPIRDANEQVTEVIKIATNVTERREAIASIAEGLEELRMGNLTHRVPSTSQPDIDQICDAFNSAANQLETMVSEVKTASSAIHTSGIKMNDAANSLSSRTETQAATLEQTAAAVEQLTSSASAAADNARNVDDIATRTRDAAKEGGQVVSDVIDAMGLIEKSSGQISQIITVIEDLAFQTNLLSLNAGVEAARAGDAGRGFAVVASEVRALAQRSADSARDIKSLITESSQHVAAGVDLVERANTELSTIFDGVGTITDNIKNIAGGLTEQSATLAQINTAVAELDHVTQRNASMVLETTEISKSLAADTDALFTQVANFRTSGGMAMSAWKSGATEGGTIAQVF